MPLRAGIALPVYLLLTACTLNTTPAPEDIDAGPGADLAPERATLDGGAPPDIDVTTTPKPDIAGSADSLFAADLTKPADLAKPADLGNPADLAKPADLGNPADLAKPADLLPAPDLAPAPGLAHRRCGWIGAGDSAGVATFVANASWFHVIHPDWYAINSDSVTIRALALEGNATLLQAAQANNVAVMPLVAGVENAGWVRTMLLDPQKRAAHIANLVNLAVNKNYPGLDIDYEHLNQSGDQAAYSTFAKELSIAMHAKGKVVSVAAGGLARQVTSTQWNYVALSQSVDWIHVMGYDYHTVGTHAGPCAPRGWIAEVAAHAASTGRPDKFILGLPNYGTTPTWFCATADCIKACGSTYATTSTHMTTCPFNEGLETGGRAPNCQTSNGALFFDDTASMEEKVALAKQKNLAGITYWTVGKEPPGFFTMIQKYY